MRGRRLLRAPAVHFAVAGALLFAATSWQRPETADAAGDGAVARPVLVVSASRLATARQEFLAVHHRPPTPAEEAALVDGVIEREVLFAHALALGLEAQPTVERRLAQIGEFVAADGGPPRSEPELAREALALGLHRDDFVVRRILVDGATRLIRAAVLAREPSEEALRAYLERHGERFRRPEEIRLATLPADAAPDEAPEELPLLPRRDLERRLGRRFAQALDAGRVGVWQGPLPSRYGPLLARVQEHRAERTAELAEVRDVVRAELRQVLADEWLATRVAQLREDYEVVLPASAEGDAATRLASREATATRPGRSS